MVLEGCTLPRYRGLVADLFVDVDCCPVDVAAFSEVWDCDGTAEVAARKVVVAVGKCLPCF